jgi:hypothetical protein
MTVEELIESVDSLKKEVSVLTVDFREVRSPEAKAHLENTLTTKEVELNRLLRAQVKYIVEPVETPPVHFLEYVQTEPWPKNFDCTICVVKAFNEPKDIVHVCTYCALVKSKAPKATGNVKRVTSLFPVVFSEVPDDKK